MSLAIEKKQGFQEGAFVIEDESDHLYNFLLSSGGAYKRGSSHFHGRVPDKLQNGIDIFNEQLPAGKRTFLFERIENMEKPDLPKHVLFIKPENYSARMEKDASYDFVMHGAEFAIAQYNKQFVRPVWAITSR
jgi:hypothetical protein